MKTFDFEGVSYGVRPRSKYQRDQIAPYLHAIILTELGYDLSDRSVRTNPLGWMLVTDFVAALQTIVTDTKAPWMTVGVDAPVPRLMAAYEQFKLWCAALPEWVDVWKKTLEQAEMTAPDPKASSSSEASKTE